MMEDSETVQGTFGTIEDISGTVKDDAPDYGVMIEEDTLENGQRLAIENGPETDEVTGWRVL